MAMSSEETLTSASKKSGNDGMSAPGNKQAAGERAKAMSDQEALGKAPAPEAVREAKMSNVQKSALAAYLKSNGDSKKDSDGDYDND